MTVAELKTLLHAHADLRLNLIFPDADPIEPEFHVTEVGHVKKTFIDCGGTVRTAETAVLQTWVAENDAEHRLPAGKLARILDVATSAGIFPAEDLPVEIEYEGCTVSLYPVASATVTDTEVRLQLAAKHTDCLAKEACGLAGAGVGENTGGGCTSGGGCC